MTPVIVSYFPTTDALDWHFEPWKQEFPGVYFVCPAFYKNALKHKQSKKVKYEVLSVKEPLSVYDKLRLLKKAATWFDPEEHSFFWIEDEAIYARISFLLLYKGHIHNWLEPYSESLYNFSEIINQSHFFGGTYEGIVSQLNEFNQLNDLRKVSLNQESVEVKLLFKNVIGSDIESNLVFSKNLVKPVYHIIGDSHTLFLFSRLEATGCRSNFVVESRELVDTKVPWTYYFTHHINNKTMHGMSKESFFTPALLNTLNVKDNDYLLFVFGEIDIRCHVWKEVDKRGETLETVLNDLAEKYIQQIKTATSIYENLTICVFGVIPPLDNSTYVSDEFPILGTIEQRIDATRLMNEILSEFCKANGLSFFSVNEHYETEKGDLKWELSDQFCHISNYHKEYAVNKLVKTMLSPSS